MAEIRALRGILYNSEKISDFSLVMAPPYDVISPKLQDELYARHEYNFVKLDLTKEEPGDKPGADKYARSAELMKSWISKGVLKRDDKPCIYYYTQTYTEADGSRPTRKGFIALTRLVDFGKGVHPHEKTLSGPKADRLNLMQTTDVNMSCIFSLYSEPELAINKMLDAAIAGKKPYIDVIDGGIDNKLWKVDDAAIIEKVASIMAEKSLFIADGHHRYETALNYRNLKREADKGAKGDELYNYVLMYFSNMDDAGMTIWPTHRVIHSIKNFNAKEFVERCSEHFNVEKFPFDAASEQDVRNAYLKKLDATGRGGISLGLKIRGLSEYCVLVLKSHDTMDKVFGDKIPDVFKNLDVTVLHSLILNRTLGITQEAQEKQENLVYVKSFDEAFKAAEREPNQLVFMLNPTRIDQVKSVALAGHVMPQKSTYFYPKILSGLVINPLSNK